MDGKATKTTVLQSSGFLELDNTEVQAIDRSIFPTWPDVVAPQDRYMTMYMVHNPLDSDVPLDRSYTTALVDAIKSAIVVTATSAKHNPRSTGVVAVKFGYKDGEPSSAKIKYSSDDPADDASLLKAVQSAKYPPTPPAYAGKMMHLSIVHNFNDFAPVASSASHLSTGPVPGVDPAFIQVMRNAAGQAKFMPKSVLVNGSNGSGYVVVSFDYLDGKASNAKIYISSNDASEDEAALSAVNQAHFPKPPSAYAGKTLSISVGFDFGYVAPSATTTDP